MGLFLYLQQRILRALRNAHPSGDDGNRKICKLMICACRDAACHVCTERLRIRRDGACSVCTTREWKNESGISATLNDQMNLNREGEKFVETRLIASVQRENGKNESGISATLNDRMNLKLRG